MYFKCYFLYFKCLLRGNEVARVGLQTSQPKNVEKSEMEGEKTEVRKAQNE